MFPNPLFFAVRTTFENPAFYCSNAFDTDIFVFKRSKYANFFLFFEPTTPAVLQQYREAVATHNNLY
jgi:hypothetical protein